MNESDLQDECAWVGEERLSLVESGPANMTKPPQMLRIARARGGFLSVRGPSSPTRLQYSPFRFNPLAPAVPTFALASFQRHATSHDRGLHADA